MTGLTRRKVGPIIEPNAKGPVMSDPNHDRSMNRMSMIAFILAAIVGLLSIIYVRPTPAQDAPTAITRSL